MLWPEKLAFADEDQEALLDKDLSANKGDFTEVETEGADALERRPQLAAALAAAKRARCSIIAAKLDRLSRDVASVGGLMAHKDPFIAAELGAGADSFMLDLYAALAKRNGG